MQLAEIQALSQMAESRDEYNRGVLTALGHLKLYEDWAAARIGLTIASDQVEHAHQALLPVGVTPSFDELISAEGAIPFELTQKLDAARAREQAAWAPIEKLRQEAIDAQNAADPLGLGQSV